MPKTTFEDLCKERARKGCALDKAKHYSDANDESIKDLYDLAIKLLEKLKDKRKTSLDQCYIGKSYVDERRHERFDFEDSHTWKSSGVSSRYSSHKKKDYGRSGMIVLAVTENEDDAFKLEKKLIEKFRNGDYSEEIANKPTYHKGGRCRNDHKAYCVYMAFAMEGMYIDYSISYMPQRKHYLNTSIGISISQVVRIIMGVIEKWKRVTN